MTVNTGFAPLLERFFTQRLMQQRQVSPHTISSYRDTFRLFLKFAQQQLHKPPSKLRFEKIDAPLVVAFLEHLEKQRGLSVRSRNLRLTALHSFFRYAAFELPAPFRPDPARARHSKQAFHAHVSTVSLTGGG
ncbi:MAG TPA: site-specific integrase [Pyrinomonadaceae bacterium]|nr:site-specific integrase [Pyrinomonadaceae bacterium]